jgi:hypothetical protein
MADRGGKSFMLRILSITQKNWQGFCFAENRSDYPVLENH